MGDVTDREMEMVGVGVVMNTYLSCSSLDLTLQ